MKTLRRLPEEPISRFDAIAQAKEDPRRSALLGLRDTIARQYEEYLTESKNLLRLRPHAFHEADVEVLKHCYDVPTIPLDKLKAAIKSLNRGHIWKCPYCGINSPATFDHYLAKNDFPEYAILHFNLIPACDECNRLKGTITSEDGIRVFINFYFDLVLDVHRWLYAKVEFRPEPVLSFRIERPDGLSSQFYATIEKHYERLELFGRYSARAAEVLSEAIASIRPGANPTIIVEQLTVLADSLIAQHGPNYWKVAAYEALHESRQCIDYMITEATH